MPAYVVDASYEIFAWNRAAVPFIGDLASVPDAERNTVRRTFRRAADDPRRNDEDTLNLAETAVADLRAVYARYPGATRLVTEMPGTSSRFAQMWAAQDVAVRRVHRKQVHHPELGPLNSAGGSRVSRRR